MTDNLIRDWAGETILGLCGNVWVISELNKINNEVRYHCCPINSQSVWDIRGFIGLALPCAPRYKDIHVQKAAPTIPFSTVGAAFLYMDVLISRWTGCPSAMSREY